MVVTAAGDARNDIYVTLEGGSFSKGTKTAERNVEVAVNVVDKSGAVIPVSSLSLSLSQPPCLSFHHSEGHNDWCWRQSVTRVCLLHLLP